MLFGHSRTLETYGVAGARSWFGCLRERKKLGAEYLQAVKELNGLIEAQTRALVKGDEPLDQFDLALDEASRV